MDLSAAEIRVLGCLLEKQRTTPDVYPLTLNALRLATNQSTNRDPVVSYDDAILRDALHRLERRGFVRLAGASARAAKYRHLLAEALPMDGAEQAVMCVLMLRGPQTPGELKQRTERMHIFPALVDVEQTLERLMGRDLVAALERRPGHKEQRYTELLGVDSDEGELATAPAASGAAAAPGASGAPWQIAPAGPGRHALAALEARVAELERRLGLLEAELGSGAAADGEGSLGEGSVGDDA